MHSEKRKGAFHEPPFRTEHQPRFLPLIEKARAEIAAALTPEQPAKLDKMLKEKERLWKR